MRIALIGATGGTGRLIAREAQARDHLVTALVRDPSRATGLAVTHTVEGDARRLEHLARLVRNTDAVVCALGTGVSPFNEVRLLSEATRALLSAMQAENVHRFVCITGMGAGDSRDHGGFFYDRLFKPLLLRRVYEDKDRQEAAIRASDRDWIIVRPSALNNKDESRAVRALTDLTGFNGGTISRADVARFVVGQLVDDRWLRQSPLITW